jgi:hypothetical protein
MGNRLTDVLSGREANALLPFLWQRGEEEAVIREEMARVHESGIGAVCVEARPHPDFYGPRWWQDMDIIMEEARARGMQVWLLDDDHFPTGHARGKLEGASADLRRLFIKENHLDASGPQRSASFYTHPPYIPFFNQAEPEPFRLVAAVAARRDPSSNRLTGELVDVTDSVQGDMLYWDIPEGIWRIFFISLANSNGSKNHKDYINMLVPDSVRVLIESVYEPMYERYRNDFGRTFAGFFSDEPGFYNDKEMFDFKSSVGKVGVTLPWRADLLEQLSASFGEDFRRFLPLLWHPGDALTGHVRATYMDLISRLYAQAFTGQVGDWCRAHQVEYIGHVLEDNGVHARLGPGAGHFFRAQWGQDMAGIDVVLWQLVPGFDDGPFAAIAGDWDGEFFHYGLAKMASSLAHMDPKKKNRSMVELFGAYGWREGLKLMKWMTDHLLVRGTNVFVPHAFSQAEFPDNDCPPHMYARGKNPQYRYYHHLNAYTNRAAHLLSGGQHVAPLAVLYHAEAEWAGAAMPFHKPVKHLLRAQIDCDVLPADVIVDQSALEEKALQVNQEHYGALVIPACEALPDTLVDRLLVLAEAGLPIVFVDQLPVRTIRGSSSIATLAQFENVQVVPLEQLVGRIRAMGLYEVSTDDDQPNLRYYHVRQPDIDVWMFTNEHPFLPVETGLSIPGSAPALAYDPFANRCTRLNATSGDGRLRLAISLNPYQSLFVITGAAGIDAPAAAGLPEQVYSVSGPWSIATSAAEQYPSFTLYQQEAELNDLSKPGALPNFSGTFRYECEFDMPETAGTALLDLGEVYETADVWLNEQHVGVRICPPYRLDMSGLLVAGKNHLIVEVTNTLAKAVGDFFSKSAAQEPAGLLGPVTVRY